MAQHHLVLCSAAGIHIELASTAPDERDPIPYALETDWPVGPVRGAKVRAVRHQFYRACCSRCTSGHAARGRRCHLADALYIRHYGEAKGRAAKSSRRASSRSRSRRAEPSTAAERNPRAVLLDFTSVCISITGRQCSAAPLGLSWSTTTAIRRIPVTKRVIGERQVCCDQRGMLGVGHESRCRISAAGRKLPAC